MYTYQEDTNTYLKIERKEKKDGWIGSAVTIDTHRPLYLIGEIRKKKRKKKKTAAVWKSRWNVGFVFLSPHLLFFVTLCSNAFTQDFTRGRGGKGYNFDFKAFLLFPQSSLFEFSTDRFI